MKYIKYILILIILAGTFIPNIKVSAQTTAPLGQCVVTRADKSVEYRGTTTYEACRAKHKAGVNAARWTPAATTNYNLLAPLPCKDGTTGCVEGKLYAFDPASTSSGTKLGEYLNLMLRIFIGLCAVLSVVMIVIGGLEYMTSELAHTKEAGKERITQAILGLLIALGAYALLFTINPDLLKSDISIENANVSVAEATKNWYFEYTNFGQNKIEGPFTERECKSISSSRTITGNIVRACFQSSTTPTVTKDWYFEYQKNGENTVEGPFTKSECESIASSRTISSSTLLRPCFQSDTTPPPTPS